MKIPLILGAIVVPGALSAQLASQAFQGEDRKDGAADVATGAPASAACAVLELDTTISLGIPGTSLSRT